MKRFFMVLAAFAAIFALSVTASAADLGTRAVWVASVYNLDYPSKPGLSASRLKSEADEIIENAAAWGLNAIILQVRPSSDALYASDIFPWSAYLSGEQGVAPDGDFDPLAYFIERAHGLEIEVHAWVNPYRITRASRPTREEAFALLSPGHPARDIPEAVVFHTDGCLYFDPGRPEARALIVSGMMEIAENYAVDGIHMDDYFYPGKDFDDAETYARYGEGFDSIGDFRRAGVTQLIETLHGKLALLPRRVELGISPFGIWANDSQHPEGSATRGDSSYFSHFADTRAWVKDEIIDYIMPQLYWPIGGEEGEFSTLLAWWEDVVNGTDVELYIGLAAYRLLEATPGGVWYGIDEIARQLDMTADSRADGAGLYRYRSVLDNPALAEFLTEYFAQPAERFFMPYPLPVAKPAGFASAGALVRADAPIELQCAAPPGSRVTVMLAGVGTCLNESAGGRYMGMGEIAAGEELYSEHFPLLISETNGFVRVEIIPQKLTAVDAQSPVSVTKIAVESDDTGGHRVTFFTQSPVAAVYDRRGSSVWLKLEPCRLGVLFEDDFFESIDFTQSGGAGIYTLILPVGARNHELALEWNASSITLVLKSR